MVGKLALVTGAGSGIGAEVALELARQGATVVTADINADALTEQVGKARADGHLLHPYQLDVTDPAAVEAVVDQVEREIAPIGILVNVAGVLRVAPILDLSDDDWRSVFLVNVWGVFHVSRAVGRRMRERRAGTIVTVGSNASGVPRMHMGAYCASKAASTLFTKCLGLELAEYGIRCNVVAPGSTDSPMLTSMWTDDYGPQAVIAGAAERFRVGIPLAKIATPADVAASVAFLVSDQAGHITMHELCVDGGATLGA